MISTIYLILVLHTYGISGYTGKTYTFVKTQGKAELNLQTKDKVYLVASNAVELKLIMDPTNTLHNRNPWSCQVTYKSIKLYSGNKLHKWITLSLPIGEYYIDCTTSVPIPLHFTWEPSGFNNNFNEPKKHYKVNSLDSDSFYALWIAKFSRQITIKNVAGPMNFKTYIHESRRSIGDMANLIVFSTVQKKSHIQFYVDYSLLVVYSVPIQSITADVGNRVTFVYEHTGSGISNIELHKLSGENVSDVNPTDNIFDDGRYVYFTIGSTRVEHAGEYAITLSANNHTVQLSAELKVLAPKPIKSIPKVSCPTSISCKLTWTHPQDADPYQEYEVSYIDHLVDPKDIKILTPLTNKDHYDIYGLQHISMTEFQITSILRDQKLLTAGIRAFHQGPPHLSDLTITSNKTFTVSYKGAKVQYCTLQRPNNEIYVGCTISENSLTFEAANPLDEGDYTFTADNEFGSHSLPVTI